MSSAAVRAGAAYVEIGARDKTQQALRSAEKRLRAFGATVTGIGTKLTAIGAAGGVAIGAVTGVLAGFDQRMAAVAAKTGATGESLDRLREKAKQLGATTQFSASQAASGMEYLAQAGFDAEQILASIPSVLSLAAAGALDLGEAADIASDVGSAFGLAADDIGKVADVIAVAAAKTNTSVSMMGETFKFVAPVAASAGQALEEMSAAAGILGNNGIKASSAGTDLKNILIAIADTNAQATLNELGVAVTDASGEMRPLLDVMRDFGAATADMTGPDRLSKSIEIFGKISGKSALILSQAGDQVDTLREQMYAADGAAANMAGTLQDGLHGSLTSLGSATDGLAIAFGEVLKPAITAVVDSGTEVVRWATEFIAKNQAIAYGLAAMAVSAGVAGAGLLALGAAAGTAAAIVAAAQTVITIASSAAAVAVWSAIAPIVVLGAKAMAVTTLVAGLGAALLHSTGQLGDVFAWVTARFKGLYSTATQVVGGVVNAFRAGKPGKAAAVLWAGIRLAFWSGVNSVIEIFMGLPNFMLTTTHKIAGFIVRTFSAAFDAIGRGIKAFLTGDFRGALSAAGNLKKAFGEKLTIELATSPSAREALARDELNKLTQELTADVTVSTETKTPSSETAPTSPPPPEADPTPEATEFGGDPELLDFGLDAMPVPETDFRLPEDLQRHIPAEAEQSAIADAISGQQQPPEAEPFDFGSEFAKVFERSIGIDREIAGTVAPDPGAADVVDQAATGTSKSSGSSTNGTTSTAAALLLGFQGDPASDRTAKATERSAELLQSIDRNLQNIDTGVEIV